MLHSCCVVLSCERRTDKKQQVAFQVEKFVENMGLDVKIGDDLTMIHLILYHD